MPKNKEPVQKPATDRPKRVVRKRRAVPEAGAGPVIEHDEIARLAYDYWEARGRNGGSPEEDWFRAEGELKARRAAGAG